MNNVIIFGNSQFAEVVHHYVTVDGGWQVVGFTTDREHLKGEEFCNLPLMPFDELKESHPPDQYKILVAVGYSKLNKVREQIFEKVKAAGYGLPSFIHPAAQVSRSTTIGDNCMVFESTTIQPFVRLGDDVIIWSNNLVGHNSNIDDHSFVTSGVMIGSNVNLGKRCFMGGGCIINPQVTIADDCILGIGTLIMEDAERGSVFKADATKPRAVSSARVKLK